MKRTHVAMELAPVHLAETRVKNINGQKVGEGSHDGYDVGIYRANTGRITIRCCYWHSEQDVSREGFLLDHRVAGVDLKTAIARARECGYPIPALIAAASEAEVA